MAELADRSELTDVAAHVCAAIDSSRRLAAVLQHECRQIKAGRRDELADVSAEKQVLLQTLTEAAAVLQAAGWEAVLALPEAHALITSVGSLAEAVRSDMIALHCALTATDRIVKIIGRAGCTGAPQPYGRGGEAGVVQGGAIALNDSA